VCEHASTSTTAPLYCFETSTGCGSQNPSSTDWPSVSLLVNHCRNNTCAWLSGGRLALGSRRRPPTTSTGSAMTQKLTVPRTMLRTVGDHAFSVTTARMWNDLLSTTACTPSLTTFKINLKAHFFQETYNFSRFYPPDVVCFSVHVYCTMSSKLSVLWHIKSDVFNNSNNNNSNCWWYYSLVSRKSIMLGIWPAIVLLYQYQQFTLSTGLTFNNSGKNWSVKKKNECVYVCICDRLCCSKEICDKDGAGSFVMCPLCDKNCPYWRLWSNCLYSRLTYVFENYATALFAAFMAVWCQ